MVLKHIFIALSLCIISVAAHAQLETVLSDDFSEDSGDWIRRAHNGASIDIGGGSLEINHGTSAQPVAAYRFFDDVALEDGDTLRFTVEISSQNANASGGDIRMGLGFSNGFSAGSSWNVPLAGYFTSVPSGGSTGASSNNANLNYNAQGNPNSVNFFNSATSFGSMGSSGESVGSTPATLVWMITRTGDNLMFSGSLNGVRFSSTFVYSDAENIINDYTFNTVALAHLYSTGETINYHSVSVEVFRGGVLADDFSEDGGDWVKRAHNGASIDIGDGALEINHGTNGQPVAAYRFFDDVVLQEGQTLRLTAQISSQSPVARDGDIRMGLGFSNGFGSSSAWNVPIAGYLTSAPSGGSTDNSKNNANLSYDTEGDPNHINFFASATSSGDLGSSGETVGTTLATLVWNITRAGDDLIFSGSLNGVMFADTVVYADDADIINDYTFNTVALAHIFSTGETIKFHSVSVQLSMNPSVARVADFGAVGDGETDDGPAIRSAVAAAVAAGPGSRVIFEDKSYRLDHFPTASYHFDLRSVSDIYFEGNGALLITHPRNNLFNLVDCSGITISGFELDVDPLPFTQGTVVAADPDGLWFDMEVHSGYRCPIEAYEIYGHWLRPIDSQHVWGMFIQPDTRSRKSGVENFIRMSDLQPSPGGDAVRIFVNQEGSAFVNAVKALVPGERYVLPFDFRVTGATFEIQRSMDCLFEDITMYAANQGMTYETTSSPGRNTFRGIYIGFRPGSDRLMTTPKDGIHSKHDRIGPIIEDSHFEGLLDDSINVGATASWIREVVAPRVYRIRGESAPWFRAGDRVAALTPSREELIDDLIVEAVEVAGNYRIVTLNREIPDPGLNESGDYFPGGFEKMGYTGLHNFDAYGAGFIIRNNVFLEQRRHAARLRSGVIEGNLVDGVGGSAFSFHNSVGHFYGTPFLMNTVIRNNIIRNTMMIPIDIYTQGLGQKRFFKNIQLIDNRFETHQNVALYISGVEGLLLMGNEFIGSQGTADTNLVHLRNTTLAGTRLPPQADAYVQNGPIIGGNQNNTNFGTNSRLHVVTDDTSLNSVRESYLRFDLSSLQGQGAVEQAWLMLNIASSGGGTHTARAISNDGWGETSITWNNRPSAGSAIATASPRSNGDWVIFDVTNQVASELAGNQLFSTAIASSSSSRVEYFSRQASEADFHPVLMLEMSFTGDHIRWAARWPDADLSDPDGDYDGNGVSNNEKRIWGLDPTDPAAKRTIVTPLTADAAFQYTRRDPALTGKHFTIWTSTDLIDWTEDTGAIQQPAPAGEEDVEIVEVTVSSHLLDEPLLFVRVLAE